MSIDTVSGGKVWTPEPEQDDNGGFPWKTVIVASIIMVTALWLFGKSFAGEYEGEMTASLWSDIWNETGFLFFTGFLIMASLFVFLVIPVFKGKKYLFLTGVAFIGSFWVLSYFINTQGSYEPVRDWMANEYNYGIIDTSMPESEVIKEMNSGKGLSVKDLETGKVKIVNSYLIDDVVYLASDEVDLNEQIEAKN